MVSTEDVHSLITALSSSFVRISTPFHITKAKESQLKHLHTNLIRRKAFNCLLFDYDEEFCVDVAEIEVLRAKRAFSLGCHDVHLVAKFYTAVDRVVGRMDQELALRVLSVLLPLAHTAARKPLPLIGYGELPPPLTLTKDLLDEDELFKYTPLLAPLLTHEYTYYPPSLFSEAALSVTDSAYSSAGTRDSPLYHTDYTISDIDSCSLLPSTTGGSYYSEVDQNDRVAECQSSLYGALTNPHMCEDMNTYLELPPIDVAPVLFDYTTGPSTAEKDTTLSNSTAATERCRPDSGMGQEPLLQDTERTVRRYHEPVSWERKRRVGGFTGCHTEQRPYLTEAGPAAFDLAYRLHVSCQLQIESAMQAQHNIEAKRHLYVISIVDLMKDVSRLLVGVSSKCFIFDQTTDSYHIRQGLVMSGMSCEALTSACQVLIDAGSYYYRLNKLSEQQVLGLTITAFLRSISHYLSTYTAAILDVGPKARSPLHMSRLLKKPIQQIKFLATLCDLQSPAVTCYPAEGFPEGIDLLSYIQKEADNYNCHHTYHLMISLLYDTSQPYLRFLQDWVFHGRCSDPFEEFIIIADPYRLEVEDRRCWTEGYLLDTGRKDKCLFMGSDFSERIYQGGKSLALLRKIIPDHDLLMVAKDTPTIDICLTDEQQLHLNSQSTLYIEKVKAMVKHKLYTRNMMLEEREQKRVEQIQQAQASQAKRLAEIYKKISEQQQRLSKKKRLQFDELKKNMESVAARKTREIAEEKERDAELVDKLTRREQLQTESDVRLEQQAREELIEYYRLMSETAAARERKALWRVRRHQLSAARQQWLSDEQTQLSEQLQRLESGEAPAPDAIETHPARSKWERPQQAVLKEEIPEQAAVQKEEGGTQLVVADQEEGGTQLVVADQEEGGTQLVVADQVDVVKQSEIHRIEQSCVKEEMKVREDQLDTASISDCGTVTDDALKSERTTPILAPTPDCCDTVTATAGVPDNVTLNDTAAARLNSSAMFVPSLAVSDVTKDLETVLSTSLHPMLALARRTTRAVGGRHVGATTFDKEYLVSRPIRKSNPNNITEQPKEMLEQTRRLQAGSHVSTQSKIDTDSLQTQWAHQRSQTARMTASKQSDEPDSDVLRLEKFRVINKRGHASHSSIQDIMYYGSEYDELSLLDESILPPVEPIILEDIAEDLTQYDDDHEAKTMSQPTWSRRLRPSAVEHSGVSLYEHVSLSTILHQSVAACLTAQISLSNQALLSYFIVELEFDKHMDVLHGYLLLAKGEFGLSFMSPLFEKLHGDEGSRRLVSTYFLTDTLSKALQHVPLKGNTFTSNVAIAKGDVPRHLETYSLNAFAWLSLTYKVSWPMNILITAEHIRMYQRIFSFMMSLKHISYLLSDSWHSLKLSTQTHSIANESQQFRQLHLIRHDMQHFVKVIHGYLALQVTQVSWHQFQTELKDVDNLDGLYDSHNRFISRCLSRCFLSHKVQQIKQVVDGILKSIYKFHALLRLGHWQQNDSGEFIHTEFEAIVKAYVPFKEFTQFLNKVLIKMTEFDKNQHLRELQIMLNFNSYYNRPTTAPARIV